MWKLISRIVRLGLGFYELGCKGLGCRVRVRG